VNGTQAEGASRQRSRPHFEARSIVEGESSDASSSFDYWVAYYYFSQERFNADEEDRQQRERLVDGLYQAFVREHGFVYKSYFCTEFLGAVALTRKRLRRRSFRQPKEHAQLHITFNILDAATDDEESLRLAELLYDCQHLALKANDVLRGADLSVCLDLIYWIVGEALARLNEKSLEPRVAGPEGRSSQSGQELQVGGKPKDIPPILSGRLREGLMREWLDKFRDAQAFYFLSAKRGAETRYFKGMMAGLLILAAIGLALAWLLQPIVTESLLAVIAGTYFGGAVGAMISVMSRMTRGRLALNYEVGRTYLVWLGIFRPVIGTVSAMFVYFVLAGGLIGLGLPAEAETHFYFLTAVAFVAGFSERFAQDMLGRVEAGFPIEHDNHELQGTASEAKGRRKRTSRTTAPPPPRDESPPE
jgi:hypothetical protein